MRKPMLVAACVLSISIVGCGAGNAQNAELDTSSASDSASSAPASAMARTDLERPFGQRHQFASGLSVTVSRGKSFKPSSSAYPMAERAIAFEITIRNDSASPYQLSELSVIAAVNGTNIREIVDPERGLNGIVAAGEDVVPGRGVQFTLAFAVTNDPAKVYLTVYPDPSETESARYIGEA